MRRNRLWAAWIIGSPTVVLIALTIVAAVTDYTPWRPLLAATLAAAVAGSILITRGPRVARQQERERRAQQDQLSVSRSAYFPETIARFSRRVQGEFWGGQFTPELTRFVGFGFVLAGVVAAGWLLVWILRG